MKLKGRSNNIRHCLWKHYLHGIYKSMHGTKKPKMKDDVCVSQDRKQMELGSCFRIISAISFLKKQNLKQMGHTHACTIKLFGKFL